MTKWVIPETPSKDDRIEELEAKLAKAMDEVATYSNDPHLVKWARRAIEELKGGADGRSE